MSYILESDYVVRKDKFFTSYFYDITLKFKSYFGDRVKRVLVNMGSISNNIADDSRLKAEYDICVKTAEFKKKLVWGKIDLSLYDIEILFDDGVSINITNSVLTLLM